MIKQTVPVHAIIPARAGSVGIPKKNIVLLSGKRLIEYTINAAKSSRYVDRIVVSSDDAEILQIAENFDVEPLFRPEEYSSNEASAVQVVFHFIDQLTPEARSLDPFILYLQPTSPLRNFQHIDRAIDGMIESTNYSVISVVEAEKPPQKAFGIDSSGRLFSLFEEKMSNSRRQDLPKSYYPNGAIYGFRMNKFIMNMGFPSNGSFPFVMSHLESIDIDNFFPKSAS